MCPVVDKLETIGADKITAEDLPEPYNKMADWLSMDQVLRLAVEFGGTNTYLPKLDMIYRAARDRIIKSEFNGYNVTQLAKKYDLTENRVRGILREGSVQLGINPDQMNLLDFL